jgi:hypothetical protein
MSHVLGIALFASLALGTFTVSDPSDVINPADWKADNDLKANFSFIPTLYMTNPIVGAYDYSGKSFNISHQTLTVNKNDTSVLVVTNESEVNIDYATIVKYGYCSDLYQASFYGEYWESISPCLTL